MVGGGNIYFLAFALHVIINLYILNGHAYFEIGNFVVYSTSFLILFLPFSPLDKMGNTQIPRTHLSPWVSPYSLEEIPNPQSRHHFPPWDNHLIPFGYDERTTLGFLISDPANPHPAGYPIYLRLYFYNPSTHSFYWDIAPDHLRFWLDTEYYCVVGNFFIRYYLITTPSLESYWSTTLNCRIVGETRYKIIISEITYTQRARHMYSDNTTSASFTP